MTDEERMAVHRQNVRDEDEYLTKLREAYLTAIKDNDDETLYAVFDELEYYIPPIELFFELDYKNILFVFTYTGLNDDLNTQDYADITTIIAGLYMDEASCLLDYISEQLRKGQLYGDNLKKLVKKACSVAVFDDYIKMCDVTDALLDKARFASNEMQKSYVKCIDKLETAKDAVLAQKGWHYIKGGKTGEDNEPELTLDDLKKLGWRIVDDEHDDHQI